jgi:hypothetical protein
MPTHIDHLRQKRERVLQDMQAIDRLRRGSLSQQFFKAPPGQTGQRGPYFILQGFFHGQKFSERIPAEQAAVVQEQVDNYRRFQSLAEQYVTLSDEITRLESNGSGSKKNFSPRRSSTPNSRKPKPS